MRRRAFLVLSAVVLTASGCGASRTQVKSAHTSSGVHTSSGAHTVGLERFEGQAAKDREYLIHDAEQELTRACMARAGFQFVTTPSSTVAAIERQARASQRTPWDSPTPAKAAREGYRYLETRNEHTPDPEQANRAIVQRLSPEAQRRWNETLASSDPRDQVTVRVPLGFTASIPGRGCFAAAWRQLYGADLARWQLVSTIANNLRTEATRRTLADEEYLKAARAWSSCMDDAGYDLPDPSETLTLVSRYYEGGGVDQAHAREVALARADARCADETHLRRIGDEVFERRSGEVAGDYEGQLLAYDEILDRAAKKARAVLRR
jgi:hypothetical protein